MLSLYTSNLQDVEQKFQAEDTKHELLQCDLCSESFLDKDLLQDHKKFKHSNETQNVVTVDEKMKTYKSFKFFGNKHTLETHKNPKTYKCDTCDKIFDKQDRIKFSL